MAKRVVITGASSGIGAATAVMFAAKGARLVLAARGEEGLADVVGRCSRAGGEAIAVPTDVTDADVVEALAARAREHLGGIDLWFSDVGIGALGKFHDVPMAAHRQIVEANLLGHMNDAHAVMPIFIEQRHGIFVNMISTGGFMATPFAAAYSASKFGLRGFSQALRAELSLYPRIHICDVYPTFVDTPGVEHAANYVGKRLSVPPGVLDPRTVAKAVVRLADHPRNTVAVGAPALALRLGQFLAPNLGARALQALLGGYFARAEKAPKTDGTLFKPWESPSGIDGGFRRPDQRRKAAVAAGSVGLVGLAVAGAVVMGRRR